MHDGESGESKSVGLMSGGERVWINECLIRAVALYLPSIRRRYGALFGRGRWAAGPRAQAHVHGDEAEVLRLGGTSGSSSCPRRRN